MGLFSSKPRTRIRIFKDDPAKCGCDEQYQVLEVDERDRVLRVVGKDIRSYQVAENVKMLAERRMG